MCRRIFNPDAPSKTLHGPLKRMPRHCGLPRGDGKANPIHLAPHPLSANARSSISSANGESGPTCVR